MLKFITALIGTLIVLACGRPVSPAPPRPERLRVSLGERTTTLGALRPTDLELPFCEAGQVFETTNEIATLRVCVSEQDGPAPAHVSFRPSGAGRMDPTASWYSGLLEPGTAHVTRAADGTRTVRVDGSALLPIRASVASFLLTLEPQRVVLAGEAHIVDPQASSTTSS
ncbi:MAG: hypothetical protein AB8I08_03965 [Sandaracinaceae bacterium]